MGAALVIQGGKQYYAANGEKWENEVTFTHTILVTNQEVEFLLFEGGETTPAMEPLHLWVDVPQ